MSTSTMRTLALGATLLLALAGSVSAAGPATGIPARSTWRGRVTTDGMGERASTPVLTHIQIHGNQVYVRSRGANPFAGAARAQGVAVKPHLESVTRGTIQQVGRSKQGGILLKVAFGGRDYQRRAQQTLNEGLASLASLGLDLQLGLDAAEGETFMHFRTDGRLEVQSHTSARVGSASGKHANALPEALSGDISATSRGVLDQVR